ncbi:MAG: hypothetical protein HY619_06745 [Thaumarchaeota archaeon]|nr:hypothetical protein [Nitrososphaerota archaeon]
MSAFVLFLILLARGAAFPPGPYMKLAAVLSTLLGLWLGIKITNALKSSRIGISLAAGLGLGAFIRILVMTPINYLVVGVLFASQFYFTTASNALQATARITLTGETDFIFFMLILTAIYNGLHTLLSILPTFSILRMPQITNRAWMIWFLSRPGQPELKRS